MKNKNLIMISIMFAVGIFIFFYMNYLNNSKLSKILEFYDRKELSQMLGKEQYNSLKNTKKTLEDFLTEDEIYLIQNYKKIDYNEIDNVIAPNILQKIIKTHDKEWVLIVKKDQTNNYSIDFELEKRIHKNNLSSDILKEIEDYENMDNDSLATLLLKIQKYHNQYKNIEFEEIVQKIDLLIAKREEKQQDLKNIIIKNINNNGFLSFEINNLTSKKITRLFADIMVVSDKGDIQINQKGIVIFDFKTDIVQSGPINPNYSKKVFLTMPVNTLKGLKKSMIDIVVIDYEHL